MASSDFKNTVSLKQYLKAQGLKDWSDFKVKSVEKGEKNHQFFTLNLPTGKISGQVSRNISLEEMTPDNILHGNMEVSLISFTTNEGEEVVDQPLIHLHQNDGTAIGSGAINWD